MLPTGNLSAPGISGSGIQWWGRGFSTEWFIVHRQHTPLQSLPVKSYYRLPAAPAYQFRNGAQTAFHAYPSVSKPISARRWAPVSHRGTSCSKGHQGIFNSAYDYKVFPQKRFYEDLARTARSGIKVYGGLVDGTLPFTLLEIARPDLFITVPPRTT